MNNRGQTLLEAVIALSVLVIVLGAVATAVLTSINNSSFIKQQNQANKLAQQGMEYIRDRINNSGTTPTAFQTYTQYAGSSSGIQCFNDFSASPPANPIFSSTCGGANVQGVFKREANFIVGSCSNAGNDFTNGLKVAVNVYWTDGKCTTGSPFCHSQKVVSCFIDPAQSLPAGGTTGI